MNILFICSRNKWRSRTAETIFKKNGQHQIRSAGTENSARIRLNQKMLNWAEIVFVMEQKYERRIIENFNFNENETELIVLEIPDNYQYMDVELIEILEQDVNYHLNN